MAGFMLKATVLFAVVRLNVGTITHTQQLDSRGTMASIKQLVRREAQMEQPLNQGSVHDPPPCAENYASGELNETTCTATNHRTIESEAVCREAAKEHCGAGGACFGSPFAVPKGHDQRTFPRRCFTTGEGDSIVYRFNDFEGEIDKLNQEGSPVGTPVCIETEYHRGNTSTDGSTVCPDADNYEVITTEQACINAAKCLGYKPEQYFTVLNSSTRVHSPLGCHINGDDNKAQFNGFDALVGSDFNETDRPLCALTSSGGSAGQNNAGGAQQSNDNGANDNGGQ